MNTGALKSPLERAEKLFNDLLVRGDELLEAVGDGEKHKTILIKAYTQAITEAEEAMIERIFVKVQAETQVIVEMVRSRAAEIAIHFSEMEAQAAGRIELAEAMKNEKMANLKSYKYGASDGGKEIAEQIRAMKITLADR